MKDYEKHVWLVAAGDAEREVMRLTAPVAGGRKKEETLVSYVFRVRQLQDEALTHWQFALRQLEKLE